MYQTLQKLPFLSELFFNGSYIFAFSLLSTKKLPVQWNDQFILKLLEIGSLIVPFIILFHIIIHYVNLSSFEDFLRRNIFSLFVFIPMIITWGDIEFCFWLSTAHLLSSILSLYETDSNSESQQVKTTKKSSHYFGVLNFSFYRKFRLSSAQMVLLSFLGVIFLGTFLLMLPFATLDGKSLSFADGLFMSTSATCVTGLATVSLIQKFNLFGQIVILALIQIGGLSIMTLYSSMTILLGKSFDMKNRVLMQDLLDVSSMEDLFAMIIDIIKYTFFIELWGAIVLTIAFTFEGYEFSKAIYFGFFHSISAFCNAGFSLFDNSLESFATNPLIHGTIAILITLGGLGFIVLKELGIIFSDGRSWARITLHTKVVIISSMALISAGTLFIFFGEFLNALDQYTLWEKIQISLFQSITLRTAGFNTIPLTSLHTYTIYGMTLFMFFGASPGSTGGGVKTTTLAILIQSIKSTLKGKKMVSLFNRTIAPPIVVRATALTFISLIIMSFFILLLMKIEKDQSFLTIFFEVVSASGTVGLSLGITPFLTALGKLAISFVMLIGRIGPLTLVLAIAEKEEPTGQLEYPEGRIMIG